MVTSIDGKVTGDFLYRSECKKATEIYYDINRSLKSNGFICGRVTMESSFTSGWYPDLTKYKPVEKGYDFNINYILNNMSGFYAVAFDPKGKLGWKSNKIIDDDPGYSNAQIIEVLTGQVDPRYLGYLKSMNIPYIFAGEYEIDVVLALNTLKSFGVKTLLLEGGSIINGTFQRAGVIDEISLVVTPTIAGKDDKPLFTDSITSDFELNEAMKKDGILILNYKKK